MYKPATEQPRSFGVLNKSTLDSISTGHSSAVSKITLPEGSYFTSRRAADDFDRTINRSNQMDDYFGFGGDDDDDDDAEIDNNNGTLVEKSISMTSYSNSKSKSESGGLSEIRARLKRYLHNPNGAECTIKRTKATDSDKQTKKRAAKTPIKSPTKKSNRTPVKRNVIFGDTGAKRKDIRNAFPTKVQHNEKQAKAGKTITSPVTLFSEVVPVCSICCVFHSNFLFAMVIQLLFF